VLCGLYRTASVLKIRDVQYEMDSDSPHSVFLNVRRVFTDVKYEQYVPEGTGGKIKKNEMGWACGAYGEGERCAQGFGGEA
jgi:hypothetical protein